VLVISPSSLEFGGTWNHAIWVSGLDAKALAIANTNASIGSNILFFFIVCFAFIIQKANEKL